VRRKACPVRYENIWGPNGAGSSPSVPHSGLLRPATARTAVTPGRTRPPGSRRACHGRSSGRRPALGRELERGVDGYVAVDAGQFDDPADRSAQRDDQPQLHPGVGGMLVGLQQVPQASRIAETGRGQVRDHDRNTGPERRGDQRQDFAGVGEVDLAWQASGSGPRPNSSRAATNGGRPPRITLSQPAAAATSSRPPANTARGLAAG